MLAGLVVAGIVTLAVCLYGLWHVAKQPITLPEDHMVYEVMPGSTLTSVAKDLENKGIVSSGLLLRMISRFNGERHSLKRGEFLLTQDLDSFSLLTLLGSNDQITYEITFIEGWMLTEAVKALSEHAKVKKVLSGVDDPKLKSLIKQDVANIEGWFYPDTYRFVKGDTDYQILKRAFERMQLQLDKAWKQKSGNTPVDSPYEALILASIIEKETGVDHERGLIGGVFAERLSQGMRLQTDPTVIYGLGDDYKGNLTKKHLMTTTPYNTYRIDGLPPTPIALPGFGSLMAAVQPKREGFLYFVAKGDGSHHFSKSLDEHNRAVREYQIVNRKKNYRSVQ